MKTLNQGEIEHLLVNLDSLIFLEGGILFICLGSQKLTAVYILSGQQDLNIDVTKYLVFLHLFINFINVYLNIDVTKTLHFCTRLLIL